ncbi:Protein MEI2-like 4 (AML4) (MEI2-like protein 4) [Durusdinium trenchii]|uniref:Protein MEI2-like 4 (AML4) (MEI2-like protein 4) n=1 Tax=Durusdinium trenchii TaxID=1381693 RepID=A0ABP0SIC9_9DINO
MEMSKMLVKSDNHSDAESTTLVETSDIETIETCSSRPLSPRSSVADPAVQDGNVIVKSSFIDFDDQCLRHHYRRLRRVMSDSVLTGWLDVPEVYEAGKFSDERVQKQQPVDPEPTTKSTECGKASQGKDCGQGQERTTVMLRNLPNNYSRDMFLELLDEQGLGGLYDFVYLPCDFCRDANLGYAFVNLVDGEAVKHAWSSFDGFSNWSLPTSKVCQVGWSGPHQGFKAHVERYRNSPVMHKSVPDTYKPVIFKDGVRKPFPRPTKKVKAPLGTFR